MSFEIAPIVFCACCAVTPARSTVIRSLLLPAPRISGSLTPSELTRLLMTWMVRCWTSARDWPGGTHIDYQLTNFPPGQSRADVQQRTIQDINKRVNSLGVSEPENRGAGSNFDRITVDLAGVTAQQAQKTTG